MNRLPHWSKPVAMHTHAAIKRATPVAGSSFRTSQVHRLPLKMLGVSLCILLLAACASKPTINSASRGPVAVPPYYTVKAGDTLSKIAMRYNLDYRELARINNIDDSYVIYTNQNIRLYDNRKGTPRPAAKTTITAPVAAIRSQPITAPSSVTTSTTARPATSPVSAPAANSVAASTPVPVAVAPVASGVQWQWPADGAVIQQFDVANNIKGVRIGGKEGDTVRAAADGDVVYASNRLVEYGNLVLVRHVNGYVSAYAHNNKILVSENDRVKAGQKIAEMGSSGSSQVMLEFQIRLNGKPVNPILLLPKK